MNTLAAPPQSTGRRAVLKSLMLGSGALLLPRRLRAAAASDQLRLAFIGAGGRGGAAIRGQTDQHYVAFADVDEARAAETYSNFPAVPRFRDFRRMLDRHADGIDAVVISTPDHSHYEAGMACIALGKHVFIEKPLAPTPWECRELERAAHRSGIKAQLGVQGHSMEALRVLREWIDAGAVGAVHTVYLWTNRLNPQRSPWSDTMAAGEAIPETLDWRRWLADRPHRPYSSQYIAGGWRNWWNFGTGAIGDIGVHMFDAVEFALEIGFPTIVEAEVPKVGAFTTPPWSRLRWDFPARGSRPAVVLHWFNGTRDGRLFRPDDISRVPQPVIDATGNGMAFVGTEGTFFVPDMRVSSRPRIHPVEREREVVANPPPRSLPRIKGSHFQDWFDAIRSTRQAGAHLGYGAPLTEMALLGTLAQRTGKAIRWNRATMTADGVPEVQSFVRPPVA
jgi:predicted dehydrogenase